MELAVLLEELKHDEDILGFAIEAPADISNLGIHTMIRRRSVWQESARGPFMSLLERYSPVEWSDHPDAKYFDQTEAWLNAVSERYETLFGDDDAKEQQFLNSLYVVILESIAECRVDLKLRPELFMCIFLSDDDHAIEARSIIALNTKRQAMLPWLLKILENALGRML